MTATVNPPRDARVLVRVDPAQRLGDYQQALRYYVDALLTGAIAGIVFVENSNADISSLHSLAAAHHVEDQVEFIQFHGLDYPGSFGRAYGEFKLLDHAMAHSRLIRSASESTVVWKVTGRYKVINLDRIAKRENPGQQMWAHCRDYPLRWADMYIFGWRKAFYAEHIRGLYTQLDESKMSSSAEVAFRDWLDTLATKEPVSRRIAPSPEIEGIRGFDGAAYQQRRVKTLIRRIADRIAPWLWI